MKFDIYCYRYVMSVANCIGRVVLSFVKFDIYCYRSEETVRESNFNTYSSRVNSRI